jgi:hypothetical protein
VNTSAIAKSAIKKILRTIKPPPQNNFPTLLQNTSTISAMLFQYNTIAGIFP